MKWDDPSNVFIAVACGAQVFFFVIVPKFFRRKK